VIKCTCPAQPNGAQENNLPGAGCCVKSPLLANKPTPSTGSRTKCNGVWREAAEPEHGRTLLPASVPPCYSSRSGRSPASRRERLLRAATDPPFPGEKQELFTLRIDLKRVRTCSPTGTGRSQREGSSTSHTQGQGALRRWEISQGRSCCWQKG